MVDIQGNAAEVSQLGLAPSFYLLRLKGDRGECMLRIRGDHSPTLKVALRIPVGSWYFLRIKRQRKLTISIEDGTARIFPTSNRFLQWIAFVAASLCARIANRLGRDSIHLSIDEYLLPLRSRLSRLDLCDLAADQRRKIAFDQFGLDDDDYLARHPEMVAGWPASTERFEPTLPARRGRIAVALHLYYVDLWPEMAAWLRFIQHPFDLHVSLTDHCPELERAIRNLFPAARIRIFPNRGRDIAPFLAQLGDGTFDRYEYVCKIHGKKTELSTAGPNYGTRWRRRCLIELLGSPARVQAVLDRMDADKSLGLVGPAGLQVGTADFPEHMGWWGSKEGTMALVEQMGVNQAGFQLDFFAGTMFWVRPAALKSLRSLNLTTDRFPDERGQINACLHHAIERVFTTAVQASGYQVIDTSGMPFSHADVQRPRVGQDSGLPAITGSSFSGAAAKTNQQP